MITYLHLQIQMIFTTYLQLNLHMNTINLHILFEYNQFTYLHLQIHEHNLFTTQSIYIFSHNLFTYEYIFTNDHNQFTYHLQLIQIHNQFTYEHNLFTTQCPTQCSSSQSISILDTRMSMSERCHSIFQHIPLIVKG